MSGNKLLVGFVVAVVLWSKALAQEPASAKASAGAERGGVPSAERILTQEVRQQSIGRRTARVARLIREEIVRELQQNRLGSPEELDRLGRVMDVLLVVARTHVPEVVEDLRSARTAVDALLAREHLGEAAQVQQTILEMLSRLVERLSTRERLGSLVERARELAARQEQLNTDTRLTALKTLGKPLQNLKPEERQALDSLAQRQQQLRTELGQLEGDIARTAEELSPSEPHRAQALRQARAFLQEKRVQPTMAEIAQELRRNQTLSAAQKEQTTLENLKELRDRLAAAEQNPFDQLARRQQELENLIAQQQALRGQTAQLTPQSPPQALQAASQAQRTLAQNAQQLATQLAPQAAQSARSLAQAAQQMQQATDRLDRNRPQEATQAQDEALRALEEARQALGARLAQLAQMQTGQVPFDGRLLDILSQQREQLALLERLSRDLGALAELVGRQEAENRNTASELRKPEGERRAEPLAQEQQALARRAEEVNRSVAQYDQESSQHLGRAGAQLQEAARRLQQKQLAEARPAQETGLEELKQARNVLQEKFGKILELLAQLEAQRQELAQAGEAPPGGSPEVGSLDDLIELANNLVELQRLRGDQEETRDQTAQSPPEEAEKLAPRQGRLRERAEDLASRSQRLTPQPAQDIREAGRRMAEARDQLRERRPRPALAHEEAALARLRRAEAAMSQSLQQMLQQQLQALAQVVVPSATLDPRDEMRLRLAGLEALVEQMSAGSWRVALPPRAREEIRQSLQERFPPGYEKLLRAYFQNLAQGSR